MRLGFERPEITAAPEHPPTCCTQRTITVPVTINAKTAQKHDYPSPAHRHSYARRSAAERSNSTIKDPATNDVSRGWCRLMGLSAMTLMIASVVVARNLRIIDAFEERQEAAARQVAKGQEPPTRRRRRQSAVDLVGATPP